MKSLEVATWTLYEVAPADAFHVRVGAVDWLVAPFDGDESTGAAGGLAAEAVVKLQASDQLLVPFAFVAEARQ